MHKTIGAAEAKTRFAEYLSAAESGQPVVITRYGKPVAALVAAEDLVQLERLRAGGPDAGLAGLVGGWHDAHELAESLDEVVLGRGTGRPVPDLD